MMLTESYSQVRAGFLARLRSRSYRCTPAFLVSVLAQERFRLFLRLLSEIARELVVPILGFRSERPSGSFPFFRRSPLIESLIRYHLSQPCRCPVPCRSAT